MYAKGTEVRESHRVDGGKGRDRAHKNPVHLAGRLTHVLLDWSKRKEKSRLKSLSRKARAGLEGAPAEYLAWCSSTAVRRADGVHADARRRSWSSPHRVQLWTMLAE